MNNEPTNEDLLALQRQITQALQKQVLSNLGGNYKSYMEALGYSIRLQDKLTNSDLAAELKYREMTMSDCIREY